MAKQQVCNSYKKIQWLKALERDNFKCVLCRYLDGIINDADEVHHVYGRPSKRDKSKDSYINLISLCKKHHHDYHFVKKLSNKEIMIKALEFANGNSNSI